ncbi:hypothetical protein [Microbacterium sp. MYb64]|uniref:hypothetical protein n=1 Tax=Microbacterium sp. MYb64 TaxID=1848691 RepID=UPI000CFC2E92|nr:hypothetical protein [Microbacterium sp. MYb64]PRB06457.1 hypothetical protein CQ044_08460 [Microbacterium sp. MYb64]
MTNGNESTAGFTRRGFLGATFAAGALLVAAQSPIRANAAAGDVTLSADGVSIVASPGGRVAIRDGSGVIRMQGSKFQTKDTATGIQVSTGGTPALVTLADGTPAIRMDYTMPTAAGTIAVYGLFSISTRHVRLEWHASGSGAFIPDGFLFSRAILSATEPDGYVALTEWKRDTGGGIPFEDAVGVAHTSAWGALHGLLILDRSRQSWTNSTWVHAPGALQSDGTVVSRADFFFSDKRPSAVASIGTAQDLGIEVWTDRTFGLWDSAGQQLTVSAQVANGATADRAVDLVWWARDFNGTVLASQTVPVVVPASGTLDHSFTLTSPGSGFIVTEVAAVSGGTEAFARTNLAAIPPRDHPATADSMFGMANYPWLQVPSATAVLDLWQSIGVDRVRIAYDGGPGLPPSAFDTRGMTHNIELQPSLTATAAEATAWASANTATAVAAGAEYFEVGNELNRPFNTGTAAQAYVDKALRPVHDRVVATGASLKLLNNGLAGMDEPWVQNFHAAGGWDLIDGIAFHPGRGNFTPDFVPQDPVDAGANGTYWNFLGGLRRLKALVAQYGPKEIWMTEAYACTKPNAWWYDTYRHAAENVFLSLALAKAEGVRCVCWYQFHDSVLGNPQVANPADAEYHYGLMNRDTSAKPSLLAYANAARLLDRATFVRWLDFADDHNKGLLFDAPDGGFAVLWNRADGYILNADHDPAGSTFPAPELWLDPWPTKTTLVVPATGTSVTRIDCIGQETALASGAGTVALTLDGAPRIYRGLDCSGTQLGV